MQTNRTLSQVASALLMKRKHVLELVQQHPALQRYMHLVYRDNDQFDSAFFHDVSAVVESLYMQGKTIPQYLESCVHPIPKGVIDKKVHPKRTRNDTGLTTSSPRHALASDVRHNSKKHSTTAAAQSECDVVDVSAISQRVTTINDTTQTLVRSRDTAHSTQWQQGDLFHSQRLSSSCCTPAEQVQPVDQVHKVVNDTNNDQTHAHTYQDSTVFERLCLLEKLAATANLEYVLDDLMILESDTRV